MLTYYRSNLDEETAGAVLERLLSWLTRLVSQQEGALVMRKFTTTLVTFFVRSPFHWQRPFSKVLNALRQDASEALDIDSKTIHDLPHASLIVLLWFSGSLVDELNRIDHAVAK